MNYSPNTSFPVAFDHDKLEDAQLAFAQKSDQELLQNFYTYKMISYPVLVKLGSSIGTFSVNNLPFAKDIIKKTIFQQFCGGESITQCTPVIARLANAGIGTILDYSVEGEGNEESYEATLAETLRTIEAAKGKSEIPFCVFKVTGLGPAILLETSTGSTAAVDKAAWERLTLRVEKICKAAADANVRLFFDAEETWYQDSIDSLALNAMIRYNQERAIVFNTYQLYLANGLSRLKADMDAMHKAGTHFGAKLVRGAYMEKEARVALSKGLPSPINPSKQASDAMYNAAAILCLDQIAQTAFCLGTHNQESCQILATEMDKRGIDPSDTRIWFAQLLGMSDNLSYPFAASGYNVAKYVPYGPVEKVLPYLIRRAQENTSVAGQTGRELQLITAELNRRKLKPSLIKAFL
jgi:proline dehydrogenase